METNYVYCGTLRPGDTETMVTALASFGGRIVTTFYVGPTEEKASGPFTRSEVVDMIPVKGRITVWGDPASLA